MVEIAPLAPPSDTPKPVPVTKITSVGIPNVRIRKFTAKKNLVAVNTKGTKDVPDIEFTGYPGYPAILKAGYRISGKIENTGLFCAILFSDFFGQTKVKQ